MVLADDVECVVRCSPGEDGTNGFFVSCFVRQSQEEVTKLGKRSRPAVRLGADEGEIGERGEGVIHTEKRAGKRSRPKKKRKSSMT